ncbi:unnamed protein product, partial [Amoebophrya sp. A120]|eukprot:GSA120T00004914001.1
MATEINYYMMTKVEKKEEVYAPLSSALTEVTEKMEMEKNVLGMDDESYMKLIFGGEKMAEFLVYISRVDVFSHNFSTVMSDDLEMLAVLKKLKYLSRLCLNDVIASCMQQMRKLLANRVSADKKQAKGYFYQLFKDVLKAETSVIPRKIIEMYMENAEALESIDPHAVYPTSIYRRCDGLTLATENAQTIEALMETSLTTTIKITQNVLDPEKNHLLKSVYEPLGRVVILIDDKCDEFGYSQQLRNYFAHFKIDVILMVFGGNEIDKDMSNVERILVSLKAKGVCRNEPVLIVGGGVLADIAGFACALYHRNTPYVMLCTSIVSGIDAGPSPRTCCDGFGYKNLYGAYHPPILTLTDRAFWGTLKKGWVRHGIAEIIKMAVVKDLNLFELLEQAGPKLVQTQFGSTPESQKDPEFMQLCDAIVGKAMLGYVKSEYGNLWETHQCRPHAYGHTWSPGYELPAGMLHGHAVATCMGFGAYLSCIKKGWISETEMKRILNVISTMELSLWHPIMDDTDTIYESQRKMTEKRGGNLCAPVPKGSIGMCGFINDMPKQELHDRLQAYKQLLLDSKFARDGLGIEVHCADVGLQDPSSVIKPATVEDNLACTPKAQTYQDWIASVQQDRNANWKNNVEFEIQPDTPLPPQCNHVQMFADDVVENYAVSHSTPASKAIQHAATVTQAEKLFMPCMVGSLEANFLKMQTMICGAKKVLDVGTFTGMSALAFADGGAEKVVTLEVDPKIAQVASKIFSDTGYLEQNVEDSVIDLRVGDAVASMRQLQMQKEQFDIIFLDADKENYVKYYNLCMDPAQPLLAPNGIILADNSMCALLYDQDTDERSTKLHEFNQHVKNDPRVEQVMLTVREGITMIKP